MVENKDEPMMSISYKYGLTVAEASKYFGICRKRIDVILDNHPELFLFNGAKKIIKRKKMEEYLNSLTNLF